jgi:hypothetical protein
MSLQIQDMFRAKLGIGPTEQESGYNNVGGGRLEMAPQKRGLWAALGKETGVCQSGQEEVILCSLVPTGSMSWLEEGKQLRVSRNRMQLEP